jgi:hypothetical protein
VLYNGILLPKAPHLREYPVQEEYGYTEKTVNSTGGEPVFRQISDYWVNPLKYTDPDGKVIGIGGDEETVNNIVAKINELSHDQYKAEKIGDKSYLLVKTNGDREGSTKYSSEINKAIESDALINIRVPDPSSFGEAFNMEYYGHGYTDVIPIDGNSSYKEAIVASVDLKSSSFVNSEGTRVQASAAEVLMHELVAHAFPLAMDKRNNSSLRNENIIRGQLGLQLRPADSKHRL